MSRRMTGLVLASVTIAISIWAYAFVRNTPYPCVVWDDAFMFVRYAARWVQGDGISWNPDDVPTWGPTSLAFVAIVAAARGVFRDPTTVALASSFASGAVFVALGIALVCNVVRASAGLRLIVIGLLLAALSGCGNALAMHFRSGMDTTFAMAYLTLYLLFAHQLSGRPSTRLALVTGFIGGLALVARPDLAVYTTLAPLALMTSYDRPVRRGAFAATVATTLATGLTWLACYVYFRTPLPLAFYVKSTGFYDAAFVRLYQAEPHEHLLAYLETTWPILAVIAAGVAARPRAFVCARLEVAVALATLAFLGFYRYRVLQVMHYGQRFYYPTLPALLYLGAAAYARVTQEPPRALTRVLEPLVRRIRASSDATFAPGLGALGLLLCASIEFIPNNPGGASVAFCPTPDAVTVRARRRWIWPGINALDRLPGDLVIATTEVGLPGALYPNHTLVDLSGLNDPTIARRQRSPERAVLSQRADVVYLHPDYTAMNRRLEESPAFRAEYVAYFPAGERRFLAVFLRRTGPHYHDVVAAFDRD